MSREWICVCAKKPVPLKSVLLAYVDDEGEPDVECGFLRHDGTWLLDDTAELSVQPTHWMEKPAHPAAQS